MSARGDDRAEAPAGADGRIARLHLGTGLLRLARVELEELAGEGRLDADGVLDLAEARWRTGDLRGAAEAAEAWLEASAAGGDPATGGRSLALAHGLVADGLTVRGRDDEAAGHVAAALAALAPGRPADAAPEPSAGPITGALAGALDALFAGISPRADAWPTFDPGAGMGAGAGGAASADAGSSGEASHPAASPAGSAMPDAIAAADDRLGSGDDAAAAVLLLLALRATPGRAQEVLRRTDAALADRSNVGLLLARAEALRVLGHHEAAGIAYAVADAHARGVAPAAAPATDPDPTAPPAGHENGAAGGAPDPEWSSE